MQWLEAALAFSVVMMLLSTVVAAIVEFFQRMLKWRQDDLQSLVEYVYEDVIEPTLKKAHKSNIEDANTFANQITKARISSARKQVSQSIPILKDQRLTSLPEEDFLARFASTNAGRALYEVAASQGKEYLDIYLNDLVDRFEEYGEHTRKYFAKRASLVSCIVAILLAFFFNIHAFSIFSSLVTDPVMRSVVIAQGQEISQRITDTKTLDENLSLNEYIEQSGANMEAYKEELNDLGIPIGWKDGFLSLPNCDDMCNALHYITLFFTGILIGLGGPFWFNIYKRLFTITNTTRQLIGLTKPENENKPAEPQQEKRPAKDIFLTALKAKTPCINVTRPLLNKNGNLT